jgi:D-apiose dehydrogenase
VIALPSTVRVAVVGAGYFSQFHLRGWANTKQVQLVAVCDSNLSKARAYATQFGAHHAYDNIDSLLSNHTIDLLDLVTPPSSHRVLIQKAIDRRIATICQKPFGTRFTEARELAELAENAQVPLIVHENFRFMPWFRHIHQILAQGTLGRLHSVSFRLRTGDGQGPQAYLDRQPYFQTMPRLLVVETAIHFIDTFRYLCGEVHAVYARLRRLNSAIAAEDAGFIHFEFASGIHGMFDGNRLNDHVAENPRRTLGEMWLEGEGGVIRLDGDANLYFKPHHAAEVKIDYDRGDPTMFGGGACEALQHHVIASLQNGLPPENCARDYLLNLRIQEAVYESHAIGRRIVLKDFEPSRVPLPLRLPDPV